MEEPTLTDKGIVPTVRAWIEITVACGDSKIVEQMEARVFVRPGEHWAGAVGRVIDAARKAIHLEAKDT